MLVQEEDGYLKGEYVVCYLLIDQMRNEQAKRLADGLVITLEGALELRQHRGCVSKLPWCLFIGY